jgi:caa(3)-type oxidase subunit IV
MSKEHAQHKHPTQAVLVRNLVVIAILMGATIVAYKIDFGHQFFGDTALASYFNNALAMTIAIFKAFLVIQIFMAVKYSSEVVKIWAWCGFVWFPVMLMMYGDYASRHWEGNQGWVKGSTEIGLFRSEIDESWRERNKKEAYQPGGHGAAEAELH